MRKVLNALTGKSLHIIGPVLLAGCQTLTAPSGPEGTPHFALEEVNGRVLVTRGDTYFVAAAEQELEIGDRVVSMDNAEAILVFTQTDEQGELIGEACQLRLPASAQITLEGYSDCHAEDAIILNNTEASSPQNAAAEPVESVPPAVREPPQADTEPPQSFNSDAEQYNQETPAGTTATQLTTTEPATAEEVLRQALYKVRVEPYLSDFPMVLQKGRSVSVNLQLGQAEQFAPYAHEATMITIRLHCPVCEAPAAEQMVQVPFAPVETVFTIVPERTTQDSLVFAIETEKGIVRTIPIKIAVQSEDQYIDVLAAPLAVIDEQEQLP